MYVVKKNLESCYFDYGVNCNELDLIHPYGIE